MLFGAAFSISLRRRMRRPGVVLPLFAFPLLALVLGLFLSAPAETSLQVGLAAPERSPRARAALTYLLASSSDTIRFIEYTDDSSLDEAVAAGLLDCGYRFAADFEHKAANGNWRGAVVRVTSPATAFSPVLDDHVAAAVLAVCWPDIARAALARQGVSSDAETLAALAENNMFTPMEVHLESTAISQPAFPGGQGASTALLPGLAALFLLIYTLLAVNDFCTDARTGFFARLSAITGKPALFVPAVAAAALPAALSCILSFALGSLFFPPLPAGHAGTMMLFVLYALYLGGIAVLMGALFPKRGIPPAAVPFVAVACMVFCPIWADVAALLPAARPFQALLPPTLFLRAASGSAAAAFVMAIGAAVCFAAAAALFGARRRLGRADATP